MAVLTLGKASAPGRLLRLSTAKVLALVGLAALASIGGRQP